MSNMDFRHDECWSAESASDIHDCLKSKVVLIQLYFVYILYTSIIVARHCCYSLDRNVNLIVAEVESSQIVSADLAILSL